MDREVKGYSLLELLLVIAILFIIASFFYKEAIVYIARERLKAATQEVLEEINWVKTKSTISSTPYGLCIDVSKNKVIIFQDLNKNANYDSSTDSIIKTIKIDEKYSGIHVNATNSIICGRAIVFDRFGNLINGIAGSITLSNNFNEKRTIKVSPLGRVRLE